jgi:riboflavin synthase
VVRGVVEGTGRLESLCPDATAVIATYSAPAHLLANIVDKGPICVDGVSLTVIRKTARTFVVSLVQFTQAHTTLLLRAPGEAVNIETDIMKRYLSQLVEARASENMRSGPMHSARASSRLRSRPRRTIRS